MVRLMGSLLLLVAVLSCPAIGIVVSPPAVQDSAAAEPDDLEMQLRTANGSNRFQIGELIPLEVLLSSSTPSRYLEPCEDDPVAYNPNCRFFSRVAFSIAPRTGWVKKKLLRGFLPIPGFELPTHDLNSHPVAFSFFLTDGFRFDKPGEYHVRLSIPIGLNDETTQWKKDPKIQPHFVTVAREIVLEIVPATPEWEQETIRKGSRAFFVAYSANRNPRSPELPELKQSMKALCNLGTPEAARVLVKLLAQGRQVRDCLLWSPSRATAVEEMQRILVDPDAPFSPELFQTLAVLQSSSATSDVIMSYPENVEKVREALVAALPQKRGEAQLSSLATVLWNPARSQRRGNDPWDDSNALPFSPPVIAAAVANFDKLPSGLQDRLIGDAWSSVRSPAMLPVVRRRADAGDGSALLRWLDLEPEAATAFIRAEIVRPAPRFSSFYLRLPDRSLPHQQKQIAANFIALRGDKELIRSATLLHRYATRAVLRDVLPFIDANVFKRSCWVQFPALAYLLKVSPKDAAPRVQQALETARSDKQWGFFTSLGFLQPSPVLERMAWVEIDEHARFADDAADYLAQYGSASAKPKLWDRLERWEKGVPPDARRTRGNAATNDKALQWQMIRSIVWALLKAHAWVLSPEELERLKTLVYKFEDGQAGCELKCNAVFQNWGYDIQSYTNNQGLQKLHPQDYLYLMGRLHYSVNQYRCPDLKSLQEKLLQFPRGTAFRLGSFSDSDRDELIAISNFLWRHGYKVLNAQDWPFLRDAPK